MSKELRKKIKVVHLISSLKIGGAEAVLIDLIRALGSRDYEHHVIYFHHGMNVDRLQELGVMSYPIHGFFCRYDPFFFMRIVRRIWSIKPDVIHSSLWAANFAARLLGPLLRIPTICAIHLGVETDGAVRNIFDQFTLRFADGIVVISDTVAQSLYDRPSWVTRTKVSIIKNGIDKEHIVALKNKDKQQRETYNLSDHHMVIGTVGRFIPRKNYPMLLEAFKVLYEQHEHARLLLVGQGEQEAQLRELAKTLNILDAVRFVVGKAAYGYYGLMDIFVLPSFQEGLSIALLEAMSCGLPSIISHAVHKHDVIEHEHNGILVPPGNKDELLFALERVMQDKALRIQLGWNAQKTVEQNFSVQNMAREYAHLYEKFTS